MKKDDYRTEFEEQKQEININGEQPNGEMPSRVDLHRKGRKSKKRSGPKLINVLLWIFPLIPVFILAYVVFSWDSPKEKPIDEVEDSQFQFETSDKTSKKDDAKDKEKEEEKTSKEKQAEQEAAEAKKKQEEQARKDEEERVRKEQEEQARKEQEAQAKKEQEEQAKKEEQPAGRTHTVAAGETLYRISVNYYKSGDGVSKIMQANGLTSNEIVTGQKLIIP